MKINCYSLGELQTNTYLVSEDECCVLIDPADEAPFLLEEIVRKKVKLQSIILTHGHFDHCMAVGEIQLSMSVPVYIHPKDVFLLDRLEKTASYFLRKRMSIIPPSNIQTISHCLSLKESMLQVIPTPGHTPGSICLFYKKEMVLFSGDTLFQKGVGRTDFSYSSSLELKKSLQVLFSLSGKTKVFPGHGETTNIQTEKNTFAL